MEEIARLLESRARSWPIQFVEKESSGSSLVGLIIAGIGAIAATIGSGWLLHFGWTVRDQLEGALGFLLYASSASGRWVLRRRYGQPSGAACGTKLNPL